MTQMIKETVLVHEIFGPGKKGTRALVCAVFEAGKLLFEEKVAMDEILVTKDIYPDVAKELYSKRYRTVVRQIERLCNRCWDRVRGDEYLLDKILGNHSRELEAPSEIIFLLACYMRYEKPFQEVLEQEPALTF